MDSTEERPPKRPRLSFAPDPGPDHKSAFDLSEARAKNDARLKSIFEGIFEKYGRDFTEIGDEIDLKTGDIVVDNGHIDTMKAEGDTGAEWLYGEEMDDPDEDEDAVGDGDQSDTGDVDGDEQRQRQQLEPPQVDSDSDNSSIDTLFNPGAKNPPQPSSAGNAIAKATPRKPSPVAEGSTLTRLIDSGSGSDKSDSIWNAPDIPGSLSTPTWSKPHFHSTPSYNPARSVSPPGTGSLWAPPRGRGRPSTGGVRRYKKTDFIPKETPQPRPVTDDWSFAETPDGNESDDPLQDYQPSPTPSVLNVRGRPLRSASQGQGQRYCVYCKRSFSRHDYISHLKIVISSNYSDEHDTAEVEKELAANGSIAESQPIPMDSELHNPSTSTPEPKFQDSPIPSHEPTPSKSRRGRSLMTPDQAKLIIKMRQIEKRDWKEILNYFPGKQMPALYNWVRLHWCERRVNPPRLSRPWSQEEWKKLDRFKDQGGLSWTDIRSELPGRLHAEIEYELLRLWVGAECWDDDQAPQDAGPEQGTINGHPGAGPKIPQQAIHSDNTGSD